jgi:superfamily II RNA helicase
MKEICSNSEQSIQDLTQFSHFTNKQFISRNDVQNFEKFLKDHLSQMNSSNPIDYEKLLVVFKGNEMIEQITFENEKDLPKLIEYLASKNMLPALFFCFKRSMCEKAVQILLRHYDSKEKLLRETKYKTKIEQLEKKRKEESIFAKIQRDKKTIKIDKNTDKEMLSDQIESTDFSLLDQYLPECSLGEAFFYDANEIDKKLKKAFGEDKDDWQKHAIKRGFFYHHSGLNSKKRVCVESLFRTKRIKLVFCTSTLAQGFYFNLFNIKK